MLTWHEGKGWGFQAGVLKGDFAHSEARGYAYPLRRINHDGNDVAFMDRVLK